MNPAAVIVCFRGSNFVIKSVNNDGGHDEQTLPGDPQATDNSSVSVGMGGKMIIAGNKNGLCRIFRQDADGEYKLIQDITDGKEYLINAAISFLVSC